MASVNKVIFIGNLGKDPEVRAMGNGESVCNFSIACTESWKDKSGAKQEKTEWVNIVMYKRLAEIAGEYLKKGSQVYIEGRLETQTWEKDGVKQYKTQVVANEMKMLGGNRDSSGGSRQGEKYQESPARKPEPSGYQAATDIDDDIPF